MRLASLFGAALALGGTLLGCAADSGPNTPNSMTPVVCGPGTACANNMAGMMSTPTGGVGGSNMMNMVMQPMGGTTAQTPAGSAMPCGVAKVVSDNCTLCHSAPTKFGAPMPLMTYADFHKPAPSNPAKKVYQVIPDRINTTTAALKMPPAPNSMDAPELMTFNAWLNAGAMADAGPGCAITASTLPMGGAGGSTGGNPPTGSGGLSLTPIAYNDPMMVCHEFRAHAQGSAMSPYGVPTQPDYYVNFDFKSPWDQTMYVRSYRLLLDNEAVVHHWLFFRNNGPKTDLAISPSSGTHPDGELVHGWAPGGGDLYLDPDVGVEMPANVGYTLELHYNNRTGGMSPDATGLEVCATPTKPAHVAVLSWLGTDAISGTSATGTCDPVSNEPIHIIGGTPHMHTKGNHMKVTVNRGGMAEVVHDEAFTFDSQIVYPENIVLMPGDTVTTTCSYDSPATFGPGTSAEMCYWFAMHWPAGSLVNNNIIGNVIHGSNSCLQ